MRLAYLFKSTLFYTVIGFLPVASQAILAPLFSNYLSQYEYGVLNLLNIFGSYTAIFIGLGFESAFSVYYFYYFKRPQILSKLISTVFISILAFATISLVLVLVFKEPVFAYFGESGELNFSVYLLPVFCISITTVLFMVIQYLFRNAESLGLYAIFSVSFFLLVSAGQYLGLRFISADAWGITMGRTIASLIMGVVILAYAFKKNGLFFSPRFFKKCFVYAYPMAIYGLLWVAFDNIDKLSMDRNFGKNILGIYGIAVLFNALLELIRTSFINAINPPVYKNILSHDEKAKAGVQTSIRFFAVALCNAIAILMVFSWPILHFFINARFHGAIVFIPVLFLSAIPRLYFSFFAMPLFYFEKTRALAVINLLSLLSSWAYLHFIGSSFGPVGICLVVTLAKSIQCLGVWVYSNYSPALKVKFGFSQIGKDNLIVGVTAASLVLAILLGDEQSPYAYLVDLLPVLTVIITLGMYGKRIFRKALSALKTVRFQSM